MSPLLTRGREAKRKRRNRRRRSPFASDVSVRLAVFLLPSSACGGGGDGGGGATSVRPGEGTITSELNAPSWP